MAEKGNAAALVAEDVKQDFAFLTERADVIGVLLFGSSARGDSINGRSDIDVCVVARDCNDRLELFRQILRHVDVHGKNYDVRIFEDLPLHIKMQVIEEGQVLYASDVYELYEYFYFFRKLWNDQRSRQKLSPKDTVELFSRRR